MKKTFTIGIAASITLLGFGTIVRTIRNSQLLMPTEYKAIRNVVNEIAKNNSLGKGLLTFTIIPGPTMKWYVDDLNICNLRKHCAFYSSINPYKRYSGKNSYEINEAMRQTNVFGFPGGSASKTGIISIYATTFRQSSKKNNLLNCVVAHELGHLSQFNQSQNEWIENGKTPRDRTSIEVSKKLQRESEIKADKEAILMLFNVGYPIETCSKVREEWLRKTGAPMETKEEHSHPGYIEWMNELTNFTAGIKKNPPKKQKKSNHGEWKYYRELNVLKLEPSKK